MSNKLEDLGKSIELAGQINIIKVVLFQINEDHLKQSIEAFKNQASFQDSAAVLNPRYNSDKSDLLRVQANTLQSLLAFWEGLKECERLKGKMADNDKNRAAIESLFI